MKVYIVGAGPGDPELLTIKAANLIKRADTIIYAGSLVSKKVLKECRYDANIYNSASMNLDEVLEIYLVNRDKEGIIVRLHTGDPSIYGAIQEQIDFLQEMSIDYEIVPGVSSFQASSAILKNQLTLPGICQTVILSRICGRTAVPDNENLREISKLKSTLVLFLSVDQCHKIEKTLIPEYGKNCHFAVVYKATWPDQKIVKGKLKNLCKLVKQAGINRHALIFVGNVFQGKYEKSKLYDSRFSHGYRESKL